MVAIKTHQANAFLAAVARLPNAVLLYGSDEGLARERAATLAKRLAERDGGDILRLDDADLDGDPDRLAIELRTVSMFGGRKIVRASAGRRVSANALRPLIEDGNLEGYLIVEAGSLRPDDALRALFEKSPSAAAVACFPDEARDLEALVRDALAGTRAELTAEARKVLLGRLGADRALSRAEIEKLALYVGDKSTIDVEDVEAAVGDAAELALDRIVMAAGAGKTAEAVAECERVVAAGESAQSVIAALQRHFLRLHRIRGAMVGGRSLEEAMRAQRPQPHFKQKAALEQQCRAWSMAALSVALVRIGAAAKAARLNAALETTLTERLLFDLAALIRPGPG
jgi:DNA polymerase-3 subunit delta